MTRRIPAAAALLAQLTALCVVTAMAADAAVELPVRVTVKADVGRTFDLRDGIDTSGGGT